MLKSKIYLLLSSFTNKERIELSYLLKSSIFNLQKEDHSLLDQLHKIIDQPKELDKVKLYSSAFGKIPYNDQKFRLSISRIYKALEKFAVLLELKSSDNSDFYQIALTRYFRKHNLKKLFKSHQQNNFQPKAIEIQLQMEFENYQFDSLEKRNQELNLQKLLDLTDEQFYAQKLKFACFALSHEAIYSTDYQFTHLKYIIKIIRNSDVLEKPAVGVYYFAYQMLVNPDQDKKYQNYKAFLFKYQGEFSIEEKRSLYFFALNRCIKKLNDGDLLYGKEGLEIYQQAIRNKTLLINGFLSRFSYRNVAMIAIRINDFELAEKLTDEFENLLRKQDRESAFHFNKALINYYSKNLDAALSNITNADFKDHLIHLAAKTLQAKIYYELDEDKILDYHLDSMEMFIIRNKVLGYHRKNYKNFIRFTKKLIKVNPFDKEKKVKLIESIKSEEFLTEKKWLMEQLN